MEESINTSVNDSTWTPITLHPHQKCSAYAIQSRDGAPFKIKKTATSTEYWTVKEESGLSLQKNYGVPGSTLCHVQTVSGDNVIEALVINQ